MSWVRDFLGGAAGRGSAAS